MSKTLISVLLLRLPSIWKQISFIYNLVTDKYLLILSLWSSCFSINFQGIPTSWKSKKELSYFSNIQAAIRKIYELMSLFKNGVFFINITYELEIRKWLLFPDLLVIRNSGDQLEFHVFRKSNNTHRYILNNFHHSRQHKVIRFNVSIRQLLKLSPSILRGEKNCVIKEIDIINLYTNNSIDSIIIEKKFIQRENDISTFRKGNWESKIISVDNNHRKKVLKRDFEISFLKLLMLPNMN